MRIAFVSTWDPHNPTLWAGSGYHMARAMQRQGMDVQFIGPLHERGAFPLRVRQLLYRKLLRKELHRDREPVVLDGYARQIEAALARLGKIDVVLSPGTVAITRLRTKIPIVTWTDATYGGIVDEYIWELRPCARSRALGNAQERAALQNVALAVYCSDWAAKSATDLYGVDPSKVKVVPFGANIDVKRSREDVERLIAARPVDHCRLLFIGMGWQRKGGDIAIEIARAVSAHGIACELTMLGQPPPPGTVVPDFVKLLGFIDKRTEDGRRRFDDLFGGSHFLLLPARAEAFGVVLCEACSFGVPALASRVGGIPTIIRDGMNGQTFPHGARADDYTAYAVKHVSDPQKYRALATSAFDEFQRRLNWDSAASTVAALLRQIVT